MATAENKPVEELIAKIRGTDENARTDAWISAGKLGTAAIKPLAAVMADADHELVLAAQRGIWKIVHTAGRPGADAQRKEVVTELLSLLDKTQPVHVRREVLWMLSEIGGDESVAPIAKLMTSTALLTYANDISHMGDPAEAFAISQLREAAPMALERIPGEKSLAALKAALGAKANTFKFYSDRVSTAPVDFNYNIAQSLRARGVEVEGYPCRKLVPSKKKRAQELRCW